MQAGVPCLCNPDHLIKVKKYTNGSDPVFSSNGSCHGKGIEGILMSRHQKEDTKVLSAQGLNKGTLIF